MQLYFQMRSWSMDGGILLKTLATTLEFLKSWWWNWKNCRNVALGPEKHSNWHIRVQNSSSTQGFERCDGISITSVTSKKTGKKNKRNTGTSTSAFGAELVKCSTWKREQRNYETHLEAKVTTEAALKSATFINTTAIRNISQQSVRGRHWSGRIRTSTPITATRSVTTRWVWNVSAYMFFSGA